MLQMLVQNFNIFNWFQGIKKGGYKNNLKQNVKHTQEWEPMRYPFIESFSTIFENQF